MDHKWKFQNPPFCFPACTLSLAGQVTCGLQPDAVMMFDDGQYWFSAGWCLGHPSQKYESQLGWLATQYMGK